MWRRRRCLRSLSILSSPSHWQNGQPPTTAKMGDGSMMKVGLCRGKFASIASKFIAYHVLQFLPGLRIRGGGEASRCTPPRWHTMRPIYCAPRKGPNMATNRICPLGEPCWPSALEGVVGRVCVTPWGGYLYCHFGYYVLLLNICGFKFANKILYMYWRKFTSPVTCIST